MDIVRELPLSATGKRALELYPASDDVLFSGLTKVGKIAVAKALYEDYLVIVRALLDSYPYTSREKMMLLLEFEFKMKAMKACLDFYPHLASKPESKLESKPEPKLEPELNPELKPE